VTKINTIYRRFFVFLEGPAQLLGSSTFLFPRAVEGGADELPLLAGAGALEREALG
jgi:hypothetical protein